MALEILTKNKDLLEYMATQNTEIFNHLKALEEKDEYGEALVKFLTKSAKNPRRPAKDEILNEYGDLIYRGLVSLMRLYPELSIEVILSKVENHIEEKIEALRGWKSEGAYINGL